MNVVLRISTLMISGVLGAFGIGCSGQTFGVPDESQQFAASVKYNNKVDILLMVDNSSSMLQYQTKFANEVPAMISNLNRLGLDYHIAIVTSDMNGWQWWTVYWEPSRLRRWIFKLSFSFTISNHDWPKRIGP